MWNIPPIIGQKVMLNPSYSHYADFNRAQARGKDGYILAVTGFTTVKWFLEASEPAITVMWENGHENSYELKALLPIDSFKTIERVEFKSGHFLNVVSERTKNIIAERVILKNDDVKHYSNFDKEMRLEILAKAERKFNEFNDSNQNKESVQMKYMSILEEIERTKRAEEVVLFLESEGDDVSTPKKHVSQETTVPSERSDRDVERMLRDWEALAPMADNQISRRYHPGIHAVVDADFLNPCAELPLNNCMTINPHQLGEIRMSPHMEEMERLGRLIREEESRVREEARTSNVRSDFEILVASLNATQETGRRTAQVPWWEENDND